MFCPRCGIIQREEQRERCSRCNGLLARPETRDLPPVRVVAAPTRRGELAQKAAGVVPPPRPRRAPEPPPAPAPPSPEPTAALGAPVAAPRQDQPTGPDAEDATEATPGGQSWPPPPGPWQPTPPSPPDRRGSGWRPTPNER